MRQFATDTDLLHCVSKDVGLDPLGAAAAAAIMLLDIRIRLLVGGNQVAVKETHVELSFSNQSQPAFRNHQNQEIVFLKGEKSALNDCEMRNQLTFFQPQRR